MEILHFKSQKERLDYLKGGFEEIMPQEVIPQEVEKKADKEATEVSEGKKPRKAKKKGKKDDTVQA